MDHIREITDQGHRIQLDLSSQVLGLEIPKEALPSDGSLLLPTIPREVGSGFVSGAVLALKAKQFDDGFYAAIELAAQNGTGLYPGKAFLLTSLLRSLVEARATNATSVAAILGGACQLGGLDVAVPPFAEVAVRDAVTDFLADELRSKPIGFYTWSPALTAIFRQDRMLQGELKDETGIAALVDALRADDQLRRTYAGFLELAAGLTNDSRPGNELPSPRVADSAGDSSEDRHWNPLAYSDLRPLLEHGGNHAGNEPLCFFPPSRAHETDLVVKLYRNRPIPEGFDLMAEVISRIRSGALPLEPTDQSGWYDYQTWSIEPLVVPERMPEAPQLRLAESYRKYLSELFKGVYTLTRETHIKQLDFVEVAIGIAPRPVPKIYVYPELSAEPLATFYQRRAQSYRFVRQVVSKTFGSEALRHLHRIRPTGPSPLSLADELEDMESLFHGAYVTVRQQLGLTPENNLGSGSQRGPEADAARFREWAKSMAADEDLGQDARMMVPVFYDQERRLTKVWIFLGWTTKPLHIRFVIPPQVLEGPSRAGLWDRLFGKPSRAAQPHPEIVFSSGQQQLACPVTAEVYVSKILNRDEFRRHCDQHRTKAAIIENL